MGIPICSSCGAPRWQEASTERTPCPTCGGTTLTFTESLQVSIGLSDQLGGGLYPAAQARDWHVRWDAIQRELCEIEATHVDIMSGAAIHDAAQQLFSFFIQAFHLRDALNAAATQSGMPNAPEIKHAISSDPRLSLLADLANYDKHVVLTKKSWSGLKPSVESLSGEDCSGGWRLKVEIRHGDSCLDGLSIARDAVTAWAEKLKSWGIA